MNATERADKWAGRTFTCECGKTHTVPIQHIYFGAGAINRLPEILNDFKGGRVYLVGDENTMPLCLEKVHTALKGAGNEYYEYMLHNPAKGHLVTDERNIGSVLMHMRSNTDLIIAMGSGTVNDVDRAVAYKCGIPYVIIGTAPSMDGYASVTSAVAMDDDKVSVVLGTPYGIICDTDIMKTAPDRMLASGAADVLGKFISVRDWKLAAREKGEPHCPLIEQMIMGAAQNCVAELDHLFSREEGVLDEIINALIISGVALSMYGSSRPAAGGEHQVAHGWEANEIYSGILTDALHGNYVGFATLAMTRLYELAESEFDLPKADIMPSSDQIRAWLKILKGYSDTDYIGVDEKLFREAFAHAALPEKRYSLVSFLSERGRLDYYVDILSKELL